MFEPLNAGNRWAEEVKVKVKVKGAEVQVRLDEDKTRPMHDAMWQLLFLPPLGSPSGPMGLSWEFSFHL